MSKNPSLRSVLLLVLAVSGGSTARAVLSWEGPGVALASAAPGATHAASDGGLPPEHPESIGPGRVSWVEGRIRLPADTPPDEVLRVLALGLARDDPRVQAFRRRPGDFFARDVEPRDWQGNEVEMGGDGRFRAPFAEGSELGFVWLEAHYLYLDEPVEVGLPAEGEISLAPKLGARLIVRFELPDGFDVVKLTPFEVQVLGWSLVDGRGTHRSAGRVGSDLSFDLGGLPADLSYFMRWDPRILPASADGPLPIEAGTRTERSYPLEHGGRVEGRVLDGSGRPFEGADVATELDGAGMLFGGFGTRRGKTGPDGRFALDSISGLFTVSASAEGYVTAKSETFEVGTGGWMSGVVLRLQRPEPLTPGATNETPRP